MKADPETLAKYTESCYCSRCKCTQKLRKSGICHLCRGHIHNLDTVDVEWYVKKTFRGQTHLTLVWEGYFCYGMRYTAFLEFFFNEKESDKRFLLKNATTQKKLDECMVLMGHGA